MNRPAWMILTTGLADGYELTKSPARVKEARENGQTVLELAPIIEEDYILSNLDLTPEMIKQLQVCTNIQLIEEY